MLIAQIPSLFVLELTRPGCADYFALLTLRRYLRIKGSMSINKNKLASLTAVGAGALALTAGKAEADTIVYSNVLNQTVGFGVNPRQAAFNTFTDIGGPSFFFKTAVSTTAPHYTRNLDATAGAAAGFGFALTSAQDIRFRTFNAGAVWSHNFVGAGGTRNFALRAWG